jgi:hypothetical protein
MFPYLVLLGPVVVFTVTKIHNVRVFYAAGLSAGSGKRDRSGILRGRFDFSSWDVFSWFSLLAAAAVAIRAPCVMVRQMFCNDGAILLLTSNSQDKSTAKVSTSRHTGLETLDNNNYGADIQKGQR